MAAVRTPSPSDGRVPCPQCGGLIHPIAGRCKHCKADLAAQRTSRPAAAAALPALRVEAAAPSLMPAPQPATPPPVYAWQPAATAPLPADEARPILPPRPTGRLDAAAPRLSIWRNWPVMVIVLASLAIATAVVLMVWPKDSAAKSGSRTIAPPPAPERMDTNPLPPPSANGGVVPPKSSGIVPRGQLPPPPVDDPPPPEPDDDVLDPDDLSNDPFSSRQPDPFGSFAPMLKNLNGLQGLQDQFLVTLFERVCARAKTCGSAQAAQMCSGLDLLLQGGTTAPACASGKRCLAKIDQLACDALTDDNLLAFLPLAQDCMEAIQDC